MDAPAFENATELVAQPQLLLDRDGEKLVTIVKATFVARRGGGPLELGSRSESRPIRPADVPWGDPAKSSIKYPSDLCLEKPGTDVIVVAAAHAPDGRPVPSFDVAVRLGRLARTLRVFGLRVWEASGAGLSAPRPTSGIEMRYDYAWGGLDATDPADVLEEPRNPVGMGIARDPSALTHRPAPYIEDPAQPIASVRTRPPPAGIGAIGRHWQPRRAFLGTYDETWLDERAPLLPADADPRANLCASPGLTAVPPLTGGEELALLNLVPGGGVLQAALPRLQVEVEYRVKGREPARLVPHLDTVVIDTLEVEEGTLAVVELVWRAAVKAPRRMKDAEVLVTERGAP